MNILSLSTDNSHSLLSGKLVYSAEETLALKSCIDAATHMRQLDSEKQQAVDFAREAAKKEGFQQGLQGGREAAKTELLAALHRQQSALHETQQGVRDGSVKLALEIVKKIALNVAPEQWVLSLAQSAARELAPDMPITLRTHTSNVAKLEALLAQSNDASLAGRFDIEGDASLQADSCVLVTESGSIEADMNTQLLAIEHHLAQG